MNKYGVKKPVRNSFNSTARCFSFWLKYLRQYVEVAQIKGCTVKFCKAFFVVVRAAYILLTKALWSKSLVLFFSSNSIFTAIMAVVTSEAAAAADSRAASSFLQKEKEGQNKGHEVHLWCIHCA